MNPRYPLVARRASHRCEYCHAPEAIFNFPFEVEHVIPMSRQGPDDESNQALACRACNLYKGDHLGGRDDVTQLETRLFHPRTDRWDEHFEVDMDSGEIRGKSAIGRVTVARLDMNHPNQLLARELWIRLRLFP